jgi:hypothetical protein
MSGTLSKRARSQSTAKSVSRAVRKKLSAKPVATASRREPVKAVKKAKAKAVKLSEVKATKKPVAATTPKAAKAKVVAKQFVSRPKVKAAKKSTAVAKPVAVKQMVKVAKGKGLSKPSPPKNALPKAQPPRSRPLSSGSVAATPPAPVPRRQAVQQALRVFEQAVKAFNRREFAEARTLFESLPQRYPHEVEVTARAQTYIQVCNLKLSKLTPTSSMPRNADELYDRGVVALNIGNFVQARALFEKALRLRPDDSHTLYSLAATHAQSGATDQALNYLRLAVQKQPRFRQRALNDNDFSVLHEDRRFLELLGAASPFDRLESRREVS